MRTVLNISLELLSDAIPGSGHGVPGGEDIGVCVDEMGYPFINGSTVKGLLRESLTNLLTWTGKSLTEADKILGVSGWTGEAEERRLNLTDFCLENRPGDAAECFEPRTFTKLQDGVVAEGSLRTAVCVCRDLRFFGQAECAAQDAALLTEAFSLIKWMGTLRSRGFGSVRFRAEQTATAPNRQKPGECRCIRYRLHTQLPVLVTDAGNTHESNDYDTKGYIPGAAVRGMVISYLAQKDPAWFEQHKSALLQKTVFLDAVPVQGDAAVIPSPMGFYENKEETRFETVVKDGSFSAGLKRAKLGDFCKLEQDTVCYWKASTVGRARIARHTGEDGDSEPFQVRAIAAGQDFVGYILPGEQKLQDAIADAFSDTVWLGADRYEGFGRCAVTLFEGAEKPAWVDEYGYRTQQQVGCVLYMLAVSPFTMLDELGNPCGLDENRLSQLLGVPVKLSHCSTAVSEYDGYNRTWQCRAPLLRMYDRGSIFRLECETPPSIQSLRNLEEGGLGVRIPEGFGRVLFLRQELFEGLRKKRGNPRQAGFDQNAATVRRARYKWLSETADCLNRYRLSASQLGSLQAQCERAMAIGNTQELTVFLEKNQYGRGARHGARFESIAGLVTEVLQQPVADTIGVSVTACRDDNRLKLLCDLFDHSRKTEGRGDQ